MSFVQVQTLRRNLAPRPNLRLGRGDLTMQEQLLAMASFAILVNCPANFGTLMSTSNAPEITRSKLAGFRGVLRGLRSTMC